MGKFFFAYLLLINLTAYLVYGIDKRRARRGQWRIRERTLLLLAFAGGSAGALLAMLQFHHKTRHIKFAVGVPLILAAQIILAVCLLLRRA